MPNPIFSNMLSRYEIRTKDDYTNALHEVMQQTALVLQRIVPQGQHFINRKIQPTDRTTAHTTLKVPQGRHLK